MEPQTQMLSTIGQVIRSVFSYISMAVLNRVLHFKVYLLRGVINLFPFRKIRHRSMCRSTQTGSFFSHQFYDVIYNEAMEINTADAKEGERNKTVVPPRDDNKFMILCHCCFSCFSLIMSLIVSYLCSHISVQT